MKLITILFNLIIILLICNYITSRSKRHFSIARQNAESYVQFARLPYCVEDIEQVEYCSICNHIEQNGFKVVLVESHIIREKSLFLSGARNQKMLLIYSKFTLTV